MLTKMNLMQVADISNALKKQMSRIDAEVSTMQIVGFAHRIQFSFRIASTDYQQIDQIQ